MISEQNLEQVKEVIYMNCKAKKTLKIGGLFSLQNLIDTILRDSSTSKFRIYEACKWLNAHGYIKNEPREKESAYSGCVHFATKKLFMEMRDRSETESKAIQQKFTGDLSYG